MRAWVEVDTKALRHNIKKIKEMAAPLSVLGVMKANAYGLGAVPISRILVEEGISFLGVACLQEARELEAANIKAEILILGAVFQEELEEITKKGFHVNISSWEDLEFIAERKWQTKIHIKVDTGMTRLGFSVEEAKEALRFAREKSLNIQGVFSHFSDADGESEEAIDYTKKQAEKFFYFAKQEDIPYRHLFNSGAILGHSQSKLGNMVRAGLCLYGLLGNQALEGFENVMTVKAKIVAKKTVSERTAVSYGRHAYLEAGETYAVLPLGYADGLKRYFSKSYFVEILGEKCEILGSVCMDMVMVRIPERIAEEVKIGMEVKVMDNGLLTESAGEETCTWDIFTGLGKRIERIYK